MCCGARRCRGRGRAGLGGKHSDDCTCYCLPGAGPFRPQGRGTWQHAHSHRCELPCTCARSFPCSAWLRSAFTHSHAPIRGVPAYAGTVSECAFSWCSAFAPPSGASSGSSGKRGIGGWDILPYFLAHFSSGMPLRIHLIPGPPLDHFILPSTKF